jgi:hypothetical protein
MALWEPYWTDERSWWPESATAKLGPEDLTGCPGNTRPCDCGCSKQLALGDLAVVTEDGDAYYSEECLEQAMDDLDACA